MLNRRLVAISRPGGIVGRLFGSLFFLIFLGMGLLFVGLIGKDSLHRLETFRWSMVPCTILSSTVASENSSENPYRFAVTYEYQLEGKTYHSQRVSLSDIRSGNYSEVFRWVERYPAKASTACYVNPVNPREAVLQRPRLWIVLMIAFPIPFVLIGAVGIWAMWQSSTASITATSLSRTARPATSNGCLALFFGIFLLAGLAGLLFLLIKPLLKIQQARHWSEVPCVIVSSNVRHHRGDKGTTYSVDILYDYYVNGKEYKANRYSFINVSSSGYDSKAALVARYRPGTKALCYVNRSDPTDAVLNRQPVPEMWFGLLPLVFAAVGAFGLFYTARQIRARKSGVVAGVTSGGTSLVTGPVTLKPQFSPATKFFGGFAVALFWNGIVSVFVVEIINGWKHGRGEWFHTFFMIPFVLIGLALIGFVAYSFVGLFSPRVKLTVSSPSALPGARIQLNWALKGQLRKVPRLQIYLEGRQEATYARGTSTSTDKSVFAAVPIVDIHDNTRIASGEAELHVPDDAIHSFTSAHNKIIWSIFVKADVTHMPDVKDEFELAILPQPLAPPTKS